MFTYTFESKIEIENCDECPLVSKEYCSLERVVKVSRTNIPEFCPLSQIVPLIRNNG